MNGNLSFAIVSNVFVLLAATAVTASPFIRMPLYTMRMEQISAKMHLLPTEQNDFMYTAENG